jgi:hypothetical protein
MSKTIIAAGIAVMLAISVTWNVTSNRVASGKSTSQVKNQAGSDESAENFEEVKTDFEGRQAGHVSVHKHGASEDEIDAKMDFKDPILANLVHKHHPSQKRMQGTMSALQVDQASSGPCAYEPTEKFLSAIKIDSLSEDQCTGETNQLATFFKYMKGGDAQWQPDEKDDTISLMVIAAGDLKLSGDELANLIKACEFADKQKGSTDQMLDPVERTPDKMLDPVERTLLMTKVQKNLPGLSSSPDVGEPRYSTINNADCSEGFTSLAAMPFVNAVQIDILNACPSFICVAKYLSGGDQTFQDDEKLDLVAVLVPSAGDLRINEAEMKGLETLIAQSDISGDGLLNARERTMLMKKWQAAAFTDIEGIIQPVALIDRAIDN